MASNTDTFTFEGAQRLANRIRRWWKAQGHEVLVWVEELPTPTRDDFTKRAASYQVRSNLVNGLPRSAA